MKSHMQMFLLFSRSNQPCNQPGLRNIASLISYLIARFMGPAWGHLRTTGPRWAPGGPHEPCYLGEHQFTDGSNVTLSSLCWHSDLIDFWKKNHYDFPIRPARHTHNASYYDCGVYLTEMLPEKLDTGSIKRKKLPQRVVFEN